MVFGKDPGEMEAQVASWSASISHRAERAQAMANRVTALSAIGIAGDGLVEVRVDSSGALTDLHLHDRISGWPAHRITGEILVALRRAQSDLVERVMTVVDDTVGADTETGRAVIAGYAGRFPAPRDGEASSG